MKSIDSPANARSFIALNYLGLTALMLVGTVCWCAVKTINMEAHVETVLTVATTTVLGGILYVARGSSSPKDVPSGEVVSTEVTTRKSSSPK